MAHILMLFGHQLAYLRHCSLRTANSPTARGLVWLHLYRDLVHQPSDLRRYALFEWQWIRKWLFRLERLV